MVKFLDDDVIKLRHRYVGDGRKISILKELCNVSFDNDNSLPQNFNIPLGNSDCNSVLQVLKDIGCNNPEVYINGNQFNIQL